MFRRFLELLSRRRVLKRRLPRDVGGASIFVSPDAQLKYLKPGKGAFDRELLAIAKDYLGSQSNVWDIGANVGVFTFAAASLVGKGRILAVEADIWLAQLISRSVLLNKKREYNITVLPVAISDQVGVASFMIAARGRASNALRSAGGNSMMGGVRQICTVPTLTLDILLNETFKPDFVKIDVEGAEKMVLNGAGKTLSSARPVFYIEVNASNCDDVTHIFKYYHYRLVDGSTGAPIDRCTDNSLAFPE